MKQYWGTNVLTTEMENTINASIDAIKINGDPATGDVTNNDIMNAIIVDQNTLHNLEQMEVDIQGATRPIPGPTEAWNQKVIAIMLQDHSITTSTVRGWLANNVQTHDPIVGYIRNFQDVKGALPDSTEAWVQSIQNGLGNGSIPIQMLYEIGLHIQHKHMI